MCLLYPFKAAKDIVKLLSHPGSPIILVFRDHLVLPNFKGTPAVGALNTQEGRKFAISVSNRRLSQNRYDKDPLLLWKVNGKS